MGFDHAELASRFWLHLAPFPPKMRRVSCPRGRLSLSFPWCSRVIPEKSSGVPGSYAFRCDSKFDLEFRDLMRSVAMASLTKSIPARWHSPFTPACPLSTLLWQCLICRHLGRWTR